MWIKKAVRQEKTVIILKLLKRQTHFFGNKNGNSSYQYHQLQAINNYVKTELYGMKNLQIRKFMIIL